MQRKDEAEVIRTLAYEIWEREGYPSGREHEHWAEANREFARLYPQEPEHADDQPPRWDRTAAERQETDALRRALWTPEPFCQELFGTGKRESRAWRRGRNAIPGSPGVVHPTGRRL